MDMTSGDLPPSPRSAGRWGPVRDRNEWGPVGARGLCGTVGREREREGGREMEGGGESAQ